jgi:hypothetical protein
MALSSAQLEQWTREGTLHIKGFFTPAQIASWRAQTFANVGAVADQPSTWPGGDTGVSRYLHTDSDPDLQARLAYPYAGIANTFTGVVPPQNEGRGPAVDPRPVTPVIGDIPALSAIVDQLLGLENVAFGLRPGPENDTMVIKWPADRTSAAAAGSPSAAWSAPKSGHIEGYNPNKDGWKGGFLLGALTYLEPVLEPGQGAFYYWPATHRPLQRYFHANPDRLQVAGVSLECYLGLDTVHIF